MKKKPPEKYSTRATGVRKTSETVSTSADGANGSNRKSRAGLGVEKVRGEGTSPPWIRSVTQMGHGSQKF